MLTRKLKPTNQARILGVIMDSDLNFDSLRNMFMNLFLVGLMIGTVSLQVQLKKSIRQLHVIQNDADRILINTMKGEHISPVLRSLYWLPVSQRIRFKILLLVFEPLHDLRPKYLKVLRYRVTHCSQK